MWVLHAVGDGRLRNGRPPLSAWVQQPRRRNRFEGCVRGLFKQRQTAALDQWNKCCAVLWAGRRRTRDVLQGLGDGAAGGGCGARGDRRQGHVDEEEVRRRHGRLHLQRGPHCTS